MGAGKVEDLYLESADRIAGGDTSIQGKHPDAWAGRWDKHRLLILGFTRPNDRGEDSLQTADSGALKVAR